MFNNLNNLIDRVSRTNTNIADILEEIFGRMKEITKRRDSYRNKQKINENLDRAIEILTDRIENINMIPGVPGSCYPICITKAFGKWNSRKYGFKGMAEKTINYWLSCSDINKDTIIFTNAWDQIDFNENFLNHFDSHSKQPDKTVCVILVTSQGFSIQYLG